MLLMFTSEAANQLTFHCLLSGFQHNKNSQPKVSPRHLSYSNKKNSTHPAAAIRISGIQCLDFAGTGPAPEFTMLNYVNYLVELPAIGWLAVDA